MTLEENGIELLAKANRANDRAKHRLMIGGQATYAASLEELTYLTWEQAEKAMDIGVRIGYACEREDYHGSRKGLYNYNPIRKIEYLHEFHKAYDDYFNKYSSRYTSITIDPSYDWVGVVNTSQLKAMIEASMNERTHGKMDKEQFWQIIDHARETAGSWQNMYEPLLKSLLQLKASEIIHWQQIFYEYQELSNKEKVLAAAYVILGGCSDDSFDYFRGWLTAQGREVFFNTLAAPETLADVEAVQSLGEEKLASLYTPPKGYYQEARFEDMLSVAVHAYENKTGGDLYDVIDKYPLSDQEKSAIADDIIYAEDIDAGWERREVSQAEIDVMLKKWLPGLFEIFNKTEVYEADIGSAPQSKIEHQLCGSSGLPKRKEGKAR